MAEGLDRDTWLHTATMLSKLHNTHIEKVEDAASLADFYPFTKKIKHADWNPFNTDDDKAAGVVIITNPLNLPITHG